MKVKGYCIWGHVILSKGSSYAVGNAAFHGDQLYADLKPAIALLVSLLDDSVAKTRANAASKNLEYTKEATYDLYSKQNSFLVAWLRWKWFQFTRGTFFPIDDKCENYFELIMTNSQNTTFVNLLRMFLLFCRCTGQLRSSQSQFSFSTDKRKGTTQVSNPFIRNQDLI